MARPMSELLQDLRYGWRRVRARPGFTAVVVLTLGLGIGANAALFSVVEGVLLRPLPLAHSESLVGTTLPLSVADFFDWQEGIPGLSMLSVYNATGLNLSAHGEPERVQVAFVSASFFSTLEVRTRLGRLFLPAEYRPGGGRVVVAAEGFWHRTLGGDPAWLGRTLILNGAPWTLVGVAQRDFRFPKRSELWAPYQFARGDGALERDSNFLSVVARLRPEVTVAGAQMQINTLLDRLHRQYPQFNQRRQVEVVPLNELAVRGIRPTLLVLQAAVALVLLLACANVTNLQLAMAAARRHEIALRIAIGAQRGRLVRQLMTESVLVALGGAALGLALAWAGTHWLTSLLPEGRVPRWDQVGIDSRVLLFTFGLGLATSLLFGLGPALRLSTGDLYSTLRAGTPSSGGDRAGRRLRDGLVVLEIALALVLLASGALVLEAFQRLLAVDPGFDPERAVSLQLNLPGREAAGAARELTLVTEMLRRVEALPGLQSASVAVGLPLSGNAMNGEFHVRDRADPPPGKLPRAEYRYVGPGYLRAMGIPLLAGRDLTAHEDRSTLRVAVVNRSLARHMWPAGDPLGGAVAISDEDKGGQRRWMQIVGVAGDVHHFDLARPPVDEIYMPLAQQPADTLASLMGFFPFTLVARTTGSPTALTRQIVETIHQVDPAQPVSGIASLRSLVAESLSQQRFEAFLLALFALLALVLAAAGAYSVSAHAVAQRTREIGLRMVLGASPIVVLRLVTLQALRLTVAGVAVGLVAAWAGARLLSSALLGIHAVDPVVLVLMAVLLVIVGVAAALRPAVRAAQVDPAIVLRSGDEER
jgi:putative ABC transport system permease protein